MIREEVYVKMAREFGTTVGVALDVVEVEPKIQAVNRRNTNPNVIINRIIVDSIEGGIYPKLIRGVWNMEKRYKGKEIKRSTIYRKVFKEINNGE